MQKISENKTNRSLKLAEDIRIATIFQLAFSFYSGLFQIKKHNRK